MYVGGRMIDQAKLDRLMALQGDDDLYLCDVQETDGVIHKHTFTFNEMIELLVQCASETPQPTVRIVKQSTGEIL